MRRDIFNLKRRISPQVAEARAGLIPSSDDIIDEIRARLNRTALTAKTVRQYRLITHSEPAAIAEVLADIRHYCVGQGLSFQKLLAFATRVYREEKSAEEGYLAQLGLEEFRASASFGSKLKRSTHN